MQFKKCLDCGKSLSRRNESGLCHACAMRQVWQRDGMRQKIVDGISAAMNRPETNARLHLPKSEEAKLHMREAQRRPELRELHSRLSKGEENPWFGKPGHWRGVFGKDHPMYGRRFKKTSPCDGLNNPFYGKKHTLEARTNNSKAHHGKLRGPDNPNWQGKCTPDPYDYTFARLIKNQVRERDGFACRLCGQPEKGRHHHVHHVFYNRKDTALDRLITLCTECHGLVHRQKKIWPPILTAKLSG